jgi:hypothetical protein
MQFSVTVETAKSFTRSFYLALAQAAPLTKAMSQARAALFADETAWYRPVLYLRTNAKNPEGKLFVKPTPKPDPVVAPKVSPPVVVSPPALASVDTAGLLGRILSNLDLTRVAFGQQISRRNSLFGQIRARLGNVPTPSLRFGDDGESGQEGEWYRQWEGFFFQYYDQLTNSERFEFRQIRAITETTLQMRNRETKKILEDNSALIDAIPDLNTLRIHLEVWINKYDGLFANTPQMCVLYVGAVDGVPFPRGIEQSIQAWLDSHGPSAVPKAGPARPKFGDPIPQPTTVPLIKVLRLDTATPDRVVVDQAFELACAVRQTSSRKLSEPELTHRRSGDVQVLWRESKPQVRLRIEVSAPDCDVLNSASVSFYIYEGRDSSVFYFHLKPRRTGEIGIVVAVYQVAERIGSARVPTTAFEQLSGTVQTVIMSQQLQPQVAEGGNSGDLIPQPTMDARALRNLIVEHFDKEGLAELCAEVQADLEVRAIDLQVDLDMVGGSSKTAIVLNLVNYLEHRGYRGCLEVAARRLRPNAFH